MVSESLPRESSWPARLVVSAPTGSTTAAMRPCGCWWSARCSLPRSTSTRTAGRSGHEPGLRGSRAPTTRSTCSCVPTRSPPTISTVRAEPGSAARDDRSTPSQAGSDRAGHRDHCVHGDPRTDRPVARFERADKRMGADFVKESARTYFEVLELERLFSEPNVRTGGCSEPGFVFYSPMRQRLVRTTFLSL